MISLTDIHDSRAFRPAISRIIITTAFSFEPFSYDGDETLDFLYAWVIPEYTVGAATPSCDRRNGYSE